MSRDNLRDTSRDIHVTSRNRIRIRIRIRILILRIPMRCLGGKMKNREKYSDEILAAIARGASCDFMKKTVIPLYIDGRESSENFCSTNSCEGCSKLFAFWLDGEYVEPPTDWVNVPVDTLVRVRDNVLHEWSLQYFARFDEDEALQFETWPGGTTSKTARGSRVAWRYCELVEDADEVSQ